LFTPELALAKISKSDTKKIAHWIYAGYRRNTANIALVVPRSGDYLQMISDACYYLNYDFEVALGVAAAESAFNPNKVARAGDHGLFQIKAPPKEAIRMATDALGHYPDKRDIKDNIYLGVACLTHYRRIMDDDLLLGLVAYNMGSGGDLRIVIKKYRATSYLEAQPYLKETKRQNPRMYPIKVLQFSLGYRVWQSFGRFPSYEKKNNARKIHALGIPGFGTRPVITAEETQNGPYYVVEPGDTLSYLAKLFLIELEDLRKANPQINGDNLRISQKLYLPAEFVWHTVQKGESLSSIRKYYGMSPGYIKAWNKKDDNILQPGEVLIVKVQN
jgi:LysM repeat protein